MSINSQNAKKVSRSRISTTYTVGLNSSKRMQIGHDVQLLAQFLINYIQKKHPQYQFKDFYDPVLVKTLRNLIKNEKHFLEFLKEIHFEIDEFFTISVYIIPHVYTTYLIKFIKETYLKNKEFKI